MAVGDPKAGRALPPLAFGLWLRQAAGMHVRLFPAQAEIPSGSEPAAATPFAVIEAQGGQSLSQAIWLSGQLKPLPLCGGLGRCGRCRVRFVRHAPEPLPADMAVFTEREAADGWRLACRRQVPDASPAADAPLDLELPPENLVRTADDAEAAQGLQLPVPSLPELSLAVDLGTTSLYWRALDAQGAHLANGHGLNPQAGAGADVMSRLAVAQTPQGRLLLAQLVRSELQRIVETLARCGTGRVARICVAGNTAMTDIFLDREVKGLCAAPYRLSHSGNETAVLPGLPPIYIPPLSGPFVGGDVSAGLAALLDADIPRPFVLADLGTNGEMALVTENGQLWLTSVPLGPALEGIGPECGQLAGSGVVTGFSLTPAGLASRFFEERADMISSHVSGCPCPSCQRAENTVSSSSGVEQPARGISATGYLSLLAVLLRTGLMRDDGHFVANPAMPLARRLAEHLEPAKSLHAEPRLHLPHGLWLAASDVEELLKVKAAFALALETLIRAAGLAPAAIAALCLAGALGEHASPDDLETLGFVPAALTRRIRAVGNASLDGAALLVLHEDMRANLARMCGKARVLALVDEPDFHNDYLRHMRFGA